MYTTSLSGWHRRDAGLPAGRVEVLAPDPVTPDRLWTVAAEQVFASEDRGMHWYPVGQPLADAKTSVHGIAVAENGRVVVLTTHRGLLRSTDGGRTWVLVEGNLPAHLEAGPLVRDPTNPATLYAGFALLPYSELRQIALAGGMLWRRVDPLSLAGGVAFLLLLAILGLLVIRWLTRLQHAAPAPPISPLSRSPGRESPPANT
jgi:hypothetical protein